MRAPWLRASVAVVMVQQVRSQAQHRSSPSQTRGTAQLGEEET